MIDADLYGPDVPRMMGLRRRAEASSVTLFARQGAAGSRLQTVSQHGVQLASAAFLLGENQALAVGGSIAQLLVRRLVSDSEWDDLDQDARRLVAHLQQVQQHGGRAGAPTPGIAGVENMSGQVCPACGEITPLFPIAPEQESIWGLIPRLASVPFSHQAARDADEGRPVMVTGAVPEQVAAYQLMAEQLGKRFTNS